MTLTLAVLAAKFAHFINEYEESRAEHGGEIIDDSFLGTKIKWTRDLKRQLRLDLPNVFERTMVRQTLFRPFVEKQLYFSQNLNEMQYQLPEVFPNGCKDENKAICFCVNGKAFYVLATDRTVDYHFTGDSQCLPLYRYTADGERVSNITEWGLRQINDHYRGDWGDAFDELAGPKGITAEDIFAYTYAVLHDPAYRQDYRVDLLREFPRLPFYHDFNLWRDMGRELLDLHIGFEEAEPYPLERVDLEGEPSRVVLRADREKGAIILDDKDHAEGSAARGVGIPTGQPLGPGVGAGPVQGTQAPGSHHRRAVQHLPFRGPQGTSDRPAATGVRSQRQDGGDRQEHGLLGRGFPGGVRGPGPARVGDAGACSMVRRTGRARR